MRLVVTGKNGQIATALKTCAATGVSVITLGRPELDLAVPEAVRSKLKALGSDAVVNAAAYTAVDQAEREPELAFAVNGRAAGSIARAAADLGIPVLQLSTDYVFDGRKTSSYQESDPTGPLNIYGQSKLAGEQAVAAANPRHIIIRTSWVYSNTGKNFVRTMLALAQTRPEVRVVNDQIGAPTFAADIAPAIIQVTQNLLRNPENGSLRGIFHMTAAGAVSWAGFAAAIFNWLQRNGRKVPIVIPIPSSEYPVPACRPANSLLDCEKLARLHNVRLPSWETSLERCLARFNE